MMELHPSREVLVAVDTVLVDYADSAPVLPSTLAVDCSPSS